MEILKVSDSGLTPQQLNKALQILEEGRVIMHATETCYGLTCDIFNEEALRRLYELKQMDFDKPVSVMVQDLKQAQRYAELPDLALGLADEFWPGPLTILVSRKASLPFFLNPGHALVGLRCPDHDLTQSLLKVMGTPLSTTSANISGVPEPYRVSETPLKPALILDNGGIPRNRPSTIVKIEDGGAEITRRGDMAEDVDAFLHR